MKKLVLLFALLVLLVSACGSDSDEPAATPAEESTSTSGDDDGAADTDGQSADNADGNNTDSSGETGTEPDPDGASDASGETVVDQGSFCDVARDLDENDPFADVDLSNIEAFYDQVLAIWSDIVVIAPTEIQADVAIIREQFVDQRGVAEKYDFDLNNLELAMEMETLDTTEADAAQQRIDAWLEENCGMVSGGFDDGEFEDGEDFDDLPPVDSDLLARAQAGDAAASLAVFFGVDIDVAECIADELNLTAEDLLADMDPATITDPICGTTMLDVISGSGG